MSRAAAPLTDLFRRRWACPVLAVLHERRGGAKFVTIVSDLGSNAGATRQALEGLIHIGWVRRNTGHGHPLRPEYLLTRTGERLAPVCADLHAVVTRLGAADVAYRKWSMPALHTIGEGPARFTQIVRSLATATDRAVSLALHDLRGADLVTRSVVDAAPPTSVYAPTPRGRSLVEILDAVRSA